MSLTFAVVFILTAWLAWLPAVVMQKRANGDHSAVSIAPVLPFSPLSVSGIAFAMQEFGMSIGVTILGSLHLALLAAFVVSIVRSYRRLKNQDITGRPRG